MKKFSKIAREQLKKIVGGVGAPDGEAGCIRCICLVNSYMGCWYTRSAPRDLCKRVYPNCGAIDWETVDDCAGCTMN